MSMTSRAPSPGPAAYPKANRESQQIPALCCDLCQWPMSLPEHCREQGEILGLLVCSQCVEDTLQAEVQQ